MPSTHEPLTSVATLSPEPIREPSADPALRSPLARVTAYVSIARPDHWFKNVFMALGVLLAFFYHPDLFGVHAGWQLLWALAATCCLASCNYVINEILDAPTDLRHPVKRFRPIPS